MLNTPTVTKCLGIHPEMGIVMILFKNYFPILKVYNASESMPYSLICCVKARNTAHNTILFTVNKAQAMFCLHFEC